MKNHHALRYLLLRYLRKEKDRVPEILFNEVAATFRVETTDTTYELKWQRLGQKYSKSYPLTDFVLYVRGDSTTAQPAIGGASRNNVQLSKSWACEALGISQEGSATQKLASLNSHLIAEVFMTAISAAILWTASPELGPKIALFVIAVFGLEFLPKVGKVLLLLPVLALAQFAPVGALVGGLVLMLCQFLDPNTELRKIRTFGLLAASCYAISFMKMSAPRPDVLLTIGFAIVAFGLTIVRWFRGSYHRSFAIFFPLFLLGLFIDGVQMSAWLALAWYGLSVIYAMKGYKLFPVQREMKLTPNG